MTFFVAPVAQAQGPASAGANVARAIDTWDIATATFRDNFASAVVENRELGPSSRPANGMREGEIDLLLASPECTNHTPAKGSKPRSETSRQTANYVRNFARRLRPRLDRTRKCQRSSAIGEAMRS